MARGKAKEKGAILERRLNALEQRKSGFSYRKIGERLGVSPQQAYNDVHAALEHLQKLGDESAEELRQLELERLDKITESMMHWVEAGNFNHANTLIKVMDRRAKYLGLDKPTEIKVDIQLFLQLQKSADEAGVDLGQVFEALINRFALAKLNSR